MRMGYAGARQLSGLDERPDACRVPIHDGEQKREHGMALFGIRVSAGR